MWTSDADLESEYGANAWRKAMGCPAEIGEFGDVIDHSGPTQEYLRPATAAELAAYQQLPENQIKMEIDGKPCSIWQP